MESSAEWKHLYSGKLIRKVTGMVVGMCKIKIDMDWVDSLKEKRHVIRSIIDRLKARFNVSVAEVELMDVWKSAVLGISCVSNESAHVESMLGSFVENDGRVDVIGVTREKIFIE